MTLNKHHLVLYLSKGKNNHDLQKDNHHILLPFYMHSGVLQDSNQSWNPANESLVTSCLIPPTI